MFVCFTTHCLRHPHLMSPIHLLFKSCSRVKQSQDKAGTTKKTSDRELSDSSLALVKTQFLRNMSHRIDTDMIHRLTRSSAKFREISDQTNIPDFVKTIFDVGEEYGTMLENVLKYYDSINGTFKTVEGPMLIRNVIADAKTDASQQMLRVSNIPTLINVEIRHDVPVSEMICDGPVLKECLQELIFNGLRHDDKTCVFLYVIAMSHDPCHVTFTVENRGIQIKDEDLVNIFTPFHNIHRGIVHGAGLGLGLARCKRMAYELGGDLHVQNGDVTTFSLTIPLKHDKEIQLQNHDKPLIFGKRVSGYHANADMGDESSIFEVDEISTTAQRPSILVVDDSAIARRQFEKMLRYVDIDVDLCGGPLDCLEKVKEKTYDVVCLDIIMPVMSGVTCAYQIREGDTSNKNSPIIIITADNSVETRELCSCIQDSTLLEKPAKRNVLFRTIMSSIQGLPQKEWIRKTWHEKQNLRENIVS